MYLCDSDKLQLFFFPFVILIAASCYIYGSFTVYHTLQFHPYLSCVTALKHKYGVSLKYFYYLLYTS